MAGQCKLLEALRDSLSWANGALPHRTREATIRKLVSEMGELADTDFSDPSEFADVLICLFDLAESAKVDLAAAVASKVAVNRKRSWGRLANGTYQHIQP